MSLARSPGMPYVAAGRSAQPYERISVRSNVHAPGGEAGPEWDGRPVYTAPAIVRREPLRIPMKAAIVLVALTAFILAMLYISAVARRAAVYKAGQRIYSEIQEMDRSMTVFEEQIAQSQDANKLRYLASQRLGMINSEGVTPIEIYAPDTRPARLEYSLSTGSMLARAGD